MVFKYLLSLFFFQKNDKIVLILLWTTFIFLHHRSLNSSNISNLVIQLRSEKSLFIRNLVIHERRIVKILLVRLKFIEVVIITTQYAELMLVLYFSYDALDTMQFCMTHCNPVKIMWVGRKLGKVGRLHGIAIPWRNFRRG